MPLTPGGDADETKSGEPRQEGFGALRLDDGAERRVSFNELCSGNALADEQ